MLIEKGAQVDAKDRVRTRHAQSQPARAALSPAHACAVRGAAWPHAAAPRLGEWSHEGREAARAVRTSLRMRGMPRTLEITPHVPNVPLRTDQRHSKVSLLITWHWLSSTSSTTLRTVLWITVCARARGAHRALRLLYLPLICEYRVYVGDPAGQRRADEASGQRAPPSEAHAHTAARAQPAT